MSDQPDPNAVPDPNPDPVVPDPDPGDRMFTQAQVDHIVQERVRRVKTEPPADYEDLKAKAAKLDEIEAANRTELENERAARELAERDLEAARASIKDVTLRTAIFAEAAKPDRKVIDPGAVMALIDRDELEIDDAGHPTNIASVMDSLLEAKPYLVAKSGARGDADLGARKGGKDQLSESDLSGMTPEQIVAARREGRLADLGVR